MLGNRALRVPQVGLRDTVKFPLAVRASADSVHPAAGIRDRLVQQQPHHRVAIRGLTDKLDKPVHHRPHRRLRLITANKQPVDHEQNKHHKHLQLLLQLDEMEGLHAGNHHFDLNIYYEAHL